MVEPRRPKKPCEIAMFQAKGKVTLLLWGGAGGGSVCCLDSLRPVGSSLASPSPLSLTTSPCKILSLDWLPCLPLCPVPHP